MKRFNAIIVKYGGALATFALALGIASTSAKCVFFFHQPKVPEGMSKFNNKSNEMKK